MDKIIRYLNMVFKEYEDIKTKKQSKYDCYVQMQELIKEEQILHECVSANDYYYFKRQPKKNEKRLKSFVCINNMNKFEPYVGAYDYIALTKKLRVILAKDKKEYLRLREYFTKTPDVRKNDVWIFVKENFTNKDKAILRAFWWI